VGRLQGGHSDSTTLSSDGGTHLPGDKLYGLLEKIRLLYFKPQA
jgi:hypothetical protein